MRWAPWLPRAPSRTTQDSIGVLAALSATSSYIYGPMAKDQFSFDVVPLPSQIDCTNQDWEVQELISQTQ